MRQTIIIAGTIMVQGLYVRTLEDGRLTIKVGNKTYTGMPVSKAA